ncbi:MAG: nitroreductase family protein [Bacteroidales bacterium]|nr:nitroreductase family protein [Candidatus Colimorpha onthohippi]
MADNYLEKRYDECFNNPHPKVKRVGPTVDELLLRNRSCRGYMKEFVVTDVMLRQIASVNSRIPSARNQQVLRFKLVTDSTESDIILSNIRMGAALPELRLPKSGQEPGAFIVVCSTIDPNPMVYIDLGISLQSMLLKANEMGLSGLIIQAFNHEAIQDRLHLPLQPIAVLAIGKAAEKREIKPINAGESQTYYREGEIHYVPKIKPEQLII